MSASILICFSRNRHLGRRSCPRFTPVRLFSKLLESVSRPVVDLQAPQSAYSKSATAHLQLLRCLLLPALWAAAEMPCLLWHRRRCDGLRNWGL